MPQFKMGRLQPIARGPRFKFRNYLKAGLPQPPASCDYSPKAMQSISNVYLNDLLGDCVIAGILHLIGIFTGNATGSPVLFSQQDIIKAYSAIGGYDPSQGAPGSDNPTDGGCDEETALNYWQNNGISGSHKILGWMEVDGTDANQVRTAMYLFENLFFGVSMPNGWVQNEPSQSGFVWDVAGRPNPQNGHCIVGSGYDSVGVDIDTWGMIGKLTYKAIAQYARQQAGGALYAVVTSEAINPASRKAASGFDMKTLVSDFVAMGGHAVAPADEPPAVDWSDIFA